MVRHYTNSTDFQSKIWDAKHSFHVTLLLTDFNERLLTDQVLFAMANVLIDSIFHIHKQFTNVNILQVEDFFNKRHSKMQLNVTTEFEKETNDCEPHSVSYTNALHLKKTFLSSFFSVWNHVNRQAAQTHQHTHWENVLNKLKRKILKAKANMFAPFFDLSCTGANAKKDFLTVRAIESLKNSQSFLYISLIFYNLDKQCK